MEFDICQHRITQIVLRAGRIIRELKGLEEEKNITVLFDETAPLLGIAPMNLTTRNGRRIPSPAEMKRDNGDFILPRKDCPACGSKYSMQLHPLCISCKDSEGGKYLTMWVCGEMDRTTKELIPDKGCGHKERMTSSLLKYCNEHGIDLPMGFKKDFGIKTITDDGVK